MLQNRCSHSRSSQPLALPRCPFRPRVRSCRPSLRAPSERRQTAVCLCVPRRSECPTAANGTTSYATLHGCATHLLVIVDIRIGLCSGAPTKCVNPPTKKYFVDSCPQFTDV